MAVALSAIAAERSGSWGMGETRTDVEAGTTLGDVIPAPAVVEHAEGITFTLTETAAILTSAAAAEVVAVAEYLAALLRPATGYPLPVLAGAPPATGRGVPVVLPAPSEAAR